MAKTSSRRKRTMGSPERKLNWNWVDISKLETVTVFELVDNREYVFPLRNCDDRTEAERQRKLWERLNGIPGLCRIRERKAVILPAE